MHLIPSLKALPTAMLGIRFKTPDWSVQKYCPAFALDGAMIVKLREGKSESTTQDTIFVYD